MGALLLLSITGILKPDEALVGFANTGLMTVAAMFIVAAAIRASGGVDLVVERVLGRPTGPRSALVRLMLPVVGLSAFLNNTPVVATMIPAVSQWARRIKVPSSALMIPLSYASILGGTITLIGTSTNLVVNGQYQVLTGKPGFALFDIAPIGLIVALVGHAVRGVRGAEVAEGASQPRPDLRRHAQLHLRGRGRARRAAGRQDHPAGGTASPGAHLPRRDRA